MRRLSISILALLMLGSALVGCGPTRVYILSIPPHKAQRAFFYLQAVAREEGLRTTKMEHLAIWTRDGDLLNYNAHSNGIHLSITLNGSELTPQQRDDRYRRAKLTADRLLRKARRRARQNEVF